METQRTENAENDDAARLGLAIHRIRVRMRAESPSSSGWSLSQLSTLARIINLEPITANALAKSEHLRPQSVAETVSALKADGLISAAPDPSDGRKILLSATEAGRTAVDEVTSARTSWLRKALEAVEGAAEDADLERTIDLLNRLADADTGAPERDGWRP